MRLREEPRKKMQSAGGYKIERIRTPLRRKNRYLVLLKRIKMSRP
jgi:hypothetical protein